MDVMQEKTAISGYYFLRILSRIVANLFLQPREQAKTVPVLHFPLSGRGGSEMICWGQFQFSTKVLCFQVLKHHHKASSTACSFVSDGKFH